jgi:flavin reductase (DIM6/NTAB) family NADH-FMN oxidoreductase RutF
VVQVSDEPVLVAVPIGNGEPTLRVIEDSGVFSVNLMAQDHHEETPTAGASGSYLLGRHTECPILINAVAWLECRVRLTVPVGDHTLVIGRVLDGERVGDYDG